MGVLASKQVIVGTTPTLVTGSDPDGCSVIIKASGQCAVYIGNGNVSTESGFELEKDEVLQLTLGPNEELYAIVEEDEGKLYFLATMNQ